MLILTRPPAVVAVQAKQYFVYPRVCPFRNRTVKACLADEKHPSRILDGYIPCSLFYFNNVDHLQTGLSKMIEDFLRKDDVFCDDFLEHILIVLANGEELSQPIAQGICTAIGAKTVSEVNFAGSSAPKPGPYFLGNNGLSEAWRCYSDPLAAFVHPIVPSLVGNKYEDPGIPVYPVPSRLYSEPKSEKRPLAGLRFAVKDVIDIAGVPTTNCCRAYEDLYGVALETAPLIQKLIEKGAIPIGKARTVQFASGSHPMDWVDWQCPFNPRGDGYQSPSMSSAGSAAAVSGYDWVDFSVGTDTFGSVIMPAAACGIYGFRPTTGIQVLTGILPVSSYLDTAGFFTRSIASATLLAKEWLGEDSPHNLTNYPTEIIHPVDLFHFENSEYQSVVERFVGLMEKFLGVKSSRLNLTERWESSAYSDGTPLRDYLNSTIPKIQLRDCYNNAKDFRQSYARQFRKEPYVDPVIRYKWDLSQDITDEQYEQGIVEKHTFEQWMSTEIIPPGSKSILLLPGGLDSPTYRDQYYG
ncbi:amidase signature domain-containing protein [Hypoxylon rubiginosum]|uniref:Amidase signature domain-containing protein n=1 Tax=Hypoxylon rubiginosum TaxID=110542 RepID=A0ACC0CM96_9PEZI|nr:amidase signature domain-containing protein [Hypoxylon rubiginosum]